MILFTFFLIGCLNIAIGGDAYSKDNDKLIWHEASLRGKKCKRAGFECLDSLFVISHLLYF
jgi:hypothetical protein